MAFSLVRKRLLIGVALCACGAMMLAAWMFDKWASLAGAALLMVLLLSLLLEPATQRSAGDAHLLQKQPEFLDWPLRLLIERLSIPLLAVERQVVRALNRAARDLFVTDDRCCDAPPALLERDSYMVSYRGRDWRVDRVHTGDPEGLAVLALLDVDVEERVGEARASAEMIQIMGHELLNGLAPIASLAESGLTLWKDSHPRRDDLMPEILATLVRRSDGLRRFAEAYRALAGLPEPVVTPFNPNDLVDELARLFAARWQDQVNLRISVGSGGNTQNADRDLLTQAIWALLQNAAEAALAGPEPPWVELKAFPVSEAIVFEVSDSGCGIEPAQQSRIFHPFLTTKPDGTGIGLSLARQIALKHGGSLTIEAGVPTTFRLKLQSL